MEDINTNDTTPPANTTKERSTKLDTAAARLPALTARAASIVGDVMSSFGAANDWINDLDCVVQHLAFEVRRKRTESAEAIKGTNGLERGDQVLVVSGPHDIVGKVGTIDEVKRVRCYVVVDGKKHYLFNSDVRVVHDPGASNDDEAPETEVVVEAPLSAAS